MTIAVVGTGVIGRSWVALFLAHGHHVTATDPHPDAERMTREAVELAWPSLQHLADAYPPPTQRLTFVHSVEEAVREATFVQENGPEDLILKRTLMKSIDAHAPARTVIASSSSGLPPTNLQPMADLHPERVIVGHPFNPVHLIPLVEVVGNDSTADWALEEALALYLSIGKRPIQVRKELPGHIANRLQAALWREAYSLVASGAATVTDIDTAVSAGPGLRWALLGPLVNQHLSGGEGGLRHVLRHLGPAADAWMDDLGDARLTPDLIEKLAQGVDAELADIDQGQLAQQRDELLITLLDLKSSSHALP